MAVSEQNALSVGENQKDGERISISVGSNGSIAGRLFLSPNAKSKMLVVHGLQGHSAWPHGGSWLAERGVSSFSFDRRGSGKSSGLRGHLDDYWQFVEDFVEAYSFLESQQDKELPIHIMANSLGSLPTILSVAKGRVNPKSVVLAAPGMFLQNHVDYSLRDKFRILTASPLTRMKTPLADRYLVSESPWIDWVRSDSLSCREVTVSFLRNILKLKINVLKNLDAVKVPVYLILASNDAIVNNSKTEKKLRSMMKTKLQVQTFNSEHYLYFCKEYKLIGQSILKWFRENE